MKIYIFLALFMVTFGTSLSAADITTIEGAKKACDGGNAMGCSNLGVIYEKGYGTDVNLNKAIEFYTKGCNAGNIRGCTGLGNFYYYGKVVKQDPIKAIKLFTKGCDSGDIAGCVGVGVTYAAMGKYKKAKVYFKQACDAGNKQACSYYIKADEKSSTSMNVPLWGMVAIGLIFLFIVLAYMFGRNNEKVMDVLGWIVGIPSILLLWYFSSWISAWWTAFKLSFFGFNP